MAWTDSAVASATFTMTTPTKIISSGIAGAGAGAGVGAGLTGSGSGYEIFGRGVRIKHPGAGEPFKVKTIYPYGGLYLIEDFSDISDWIDYDNINGVSSQVTFDGLSCLKFDTNVAAASNYASRYRVTDPFSSLFTLHFKSYFDLIGTYSNIDNFFIWLDASNYSFSCDICSDQIIIYNGTSYINVGDYAELDEWQEWVFKFNSVTHLVDVYLKDTTNTSGVLQKIITAASWNYPTGYGSGYIEFTQFGRTSADQISYLDFLYLSTN